MTRLRASIGVSHSYSSRLSLVQPTAIEVNVTAVVFLFVFDPLAKINLVPKLLPLSQEVARGQRNYFQILLLLGHVMCYVCFVVAMAFAAQELVLEVLQALTSNTQIVKETMQKGMQQPPSKPGFLFQNLSHRKIGRKHDPETLKPKAFVSQMLRKIEKKA